MMNKKSLYKLEYNKIIEKLTEHAGSFGGQERCRKLKPKTEISEIERMQEETAAAFTRIVKKGRPSFGGCSPVSESMMRLEIGGTLGSGELLRICKVLETAGHVKNYGRHDNADDMQDILDGYFEQLVPVSILSTEIRRCIPAEDEISDDASPELKRIRRAMGQINDKVHATLSSMVNGSLRTYLQDPIITMRGDRYCIPVKAEYRGQVPGMIHDQSSTGSTLFIEPMAVVKLNNDLKELYGKEQEEIQVILARLSADAAEYVSEIRTDYATLTELDFIFARGALALDMNASKPTFNQERRIRIREGRHPLLDKKKVVPISLTLGEDFDLLIVTGPNTGGKTVSLKTVGLFQLMGQAGLHIPALDRSELGVFREVYADIGDEQSIEQNLSTFSSHMTNVVSFIKQVDEDSLVLFDELGAGTDPTEGAALATAILNHLHCQGIRTMATTHYSELKVYALSTPGVENASCEFDVETLAPTYRLLIGIPGKSNAFAISRRLGLPEDVIAAAQGQMSGESVRFEDILTQLEEKRQALEKREQEADRLLRQREEDARRAREFREQMERAKDNARSRGEAEAKRILRDARTAADQVFQELSEMRKAQAKAERMLNENEARAALRRTLNEAEEAVSRRDARQEPIPKPSRPIRAGDLVEIPGVKTPAEVVSVGKDGTLQLKAGILKMKAKVDEVRLIEDDERAARKKTPSVTIRQNADRALRASAARELDIRGMETLEAESVVENFISAAVMGKLETVTIIHGKGTGALRKAVHDILRRNKAVKSFRLGVYGEGESGVTVVTLK